MVFLESEVAVIGGALRKKLNIIFNKDLKNQRFSCLDFNVSLQDQGIRSLEGEGSENLMYFY